MARYTVTKATPEYTGGGIWLFHGEVNNGEAWFLTDDYGCTLILDEDPQDFDESLYPEWQELHTIVELDGEERNTFNNQLLDELAKDGAKHGFTSMDVDYYRSYFQLPR